MDDILKYYEILGLKPGATEGEIKQAYRDLAKVWHPDRFTGSPRLQEKAQEKLKEINLAYDYLKAHKYTPPDDEPPYSEEEEYYHEEEPVQEEKRKHEESRTAYTTTYKDSFFSKIPKWVVIFIAIGLIRALYGLLNTPPKPKRTEYKPPNYYSAPSSRVLPEKGSASAVKGEKLELSKMSPGIYRYVDDSGQIHFTNYPKDPKYNYELIIPNRDQEVEQHPDASFAKPKTSLKYPQKREIVVPPSIEKSDKAGTGKLMEAPPKSGRVSIGTLNYFTIGSSRGEVLAVQGTPTSIVGDTWYYGYSTVAFYNDRVRGYSNTSENLQIKLTPQIGSEATSPAGYFTLGSTKDEVIAAQGTPSGIVGDTWYYKYSTITFHSERVKGYSNTSNNLRVSILPKTQSSSSLKGYFTMGSTYDEVLAVQGTPSGIVGDTWYYHYSTVTFYDGSVKGYSNTSHNLKVKLE